MPLRTVGDYLKRWGMSPQKPVKRAYERSEPAVKRWLEQEYPEIKKQAKAEKAEIHWADETGLSSGDNRGRGYSLVGQTPVRAHKGRAEKVNMISSVTNRGTLRFMFYDGSFNQAVFLRFLKRLVKSAKRRVVVILDNLRVHHGKLVKAWVEANKTKIRLEYLPSYSPDLNPDEFLNRDLKQEISKRPERRTKGNFKKETMSLMRSLQRRPKRIEGYFNSTTISYAA